MDRQIINRRYRLERKIGEGATAEVFLGFDIVLNRRVAIKTLRSQYSANRAFRLRFEREAQTAARLSHPNIIAIFDVGEDHRSPYIVMEYVEGQTLRDIIDAEGPFHPDDVAVLVEQVAAGLDYAHRHGLVHRDIKPQNILVDRHGLAKVVDFGIAKGLSDSTLTETGSSIGTVQYISPEQASGLMATPESDIYALGVIAYEMLTGQLPFAADSAVGIAMRHLNDPPPDPAELNPDVPPEAADIVLQSLEKNPTRRYPTAGAFARALSDWRLYEASPRLAAKLEPTPESTNPRERPRDPFETIPLRAIADNEVASPTVPEFALPERDAAESRGSKSWIAGLIVVVIAAGLLWYGFDLSDRLDAGRDDPSPTSTAGAAAIVDDPTPTPSDTPAADEAETVAPASVTVPDVVGASEADAESALSDVGLTVSLGQAQPSETIPARAVVSQSPVGGTTVTQETVVTITLSSGPAPVDLTALNVTDIPRDDVVSELTALGLNVVLAEEGSSAVDAGNVIRVEPDDSASPGDDVTVYVSVGDRVLIPASLQGQPVARIRSALEDLGLEIAGEIAVSRATLESQGIDLDEVGIANGDVVGVQDNDARFGGWVDSGDSVTLIYYDDSLALQAIDRTG